MFHRSVARSVALGIATFFASLAAFASAAPQGSVTVSLETQVVSISVTGGDVAFGEGPYGSEVSLVAHPTSTDGAAAPMIANNGNVDITSLDLSYANTPQASCDDGAGSWTADGGMVGTDQFTMRAYASATEDWTLFTGGSFPIDPTTGTGNLLERSSHRRLKPEEQVPLYLQLTTPSLAIAGGDGCTIELTVVAASALPTG